MENAQHYRPNRLWKEETIIPKLPLDIGKSTAVLGLQGQFSNQLGYIMVYWGMVLNIPRIQTTLVLIEKALVL